MIKKIFVSLLVLFLGFSVLLVGIKRRQNQIRGIQTGPTRGLVLPHHDLASDLINQALEKVSLNSSYSYIVILAPKHFEGGNGRILTSNQVGGDEMASELLNDLNREERYATLDQEYLNKEHAITILLPYLKHYFPQAIIMPLVLAPDLTLIEIEDLAERLETIIPKDSLILASIDFSHNTMSLEGLRKNEETLEIMKNFDYLTLRQLKDDHLDSPVAMSVLLKLMQAYKSTNWELWVSSHGGVLTGNLNLLGTSYITGVFRE